MSAARQEILDRVRGALGGRAAPSIEVPPAYRRAGTCDRVALVGLLAERISDYRATVRRTGADGVRGAVEAVCRERGVGRLGVPPAVPPEWRPGNAELVEDDGLDTQALDALDGVLTGCELAIAETGRSCSPRDRARAGARSRSSPTSTSASSRPRRSSSSSPRRSHGSARWWRARAAR